MRKSRLHTRYTMADDGSWRSLRPHEPRSDCDDLRYDDGPQCEHAHRTSSGANRCSMNREVAQPA